MSGPRQFDWVPQGSTGFHRVPRGSAGSTGFHVGSSTRSLMKNAVLLAATVAGCGLAWRSGSLPRPAALSAQGAPALHDWVTDGGDNQRTGWNPNEKTLTKENVGNLKLLWKLPTGNQ